MKALLPVILVSLTGLASFTIVRQGGSTVNWTTMDDLNSLATSKKWEKEKRKVIIDLYTDWCGWCKRMDVATYEQQAIADYINANFYAVKFNAEQRDSVVFGGYTYKFMVSQQVKDPSGKVIQERGTHELAIALGNSNGRMGYPTTVFLDENLGLIQALPGYIGPDQMLPMLKYFGEDHYKTTTWETFQSTYSDPNKGGTIGD